jgi:hypothetical protein
MAEAYVEMGKINLSICNEFHHAEQQDCTNYENLLKKDDKNGTV